MASPDKAQLLQGCPPSASLPPAATPTALTAVAPAVNHLLLSPQSTRHPDCAPVKPVRCDPEYSTAYVPKPTLAACRPGCPGAAGVRQLITPAPLLSLTAQRPAPITPPTPLSHPPRSQRPQPPRSAGGVIVGNFSLNSLRSILRQPRRSKTLENIDISYVPYSFLPSRAPCT